MRAARIGSSRPSSTARSAVAFAMATYDGMVAGAFSAMSWRWAWTVFTSPRTIGPVSAASPWASALSRAAESSGRSVAAGSSAPEAASSSIAWLTRVTRWFAPWARPAW